jgi:hypothetical protein
VRFSVEGRHDSAAVAGVNLGWARERRGSARAETEISAPEMFPPFIETSCPLGDGRCARRASR